MVVNLYGNEDWSAEFVVYQSGARESYKIKLNYQGENLKKIKTFQYYIISKSGKVDYKESNAELNEEGIFVNELLVDNSPTTPVGDELILTMEWNDNSESFNLKSRN